VEAKVFGQGMLEKLEVPSLDLDRTFFRHAVGLDFGFSLMKRCRIVHTIDE